MKPLYKRCAKCGKKNPARPGYFAADKHSPDGLAAVCRSCQKHIEDLRRRKGETRLQVLINQSVQAQMRRALRGKRCGFDWARILGYTMEDLKCHLEFLFRPGMTWKNQGRWHIDHVRPKASFQFSSVSDPQFKQCWSLANLQPLWARDNFRKGSKWADKPNQANAS